MRIVLYWSKIHTINLELDNPEHSKAALEKTADVKATVFKELDSDKLFETVEHLPQSAGVSNIEYTVALKLSKRGKTVSLSRKPSDFQKHKFV